MSTRQNKKQRKGRNNANNRERTVTTLTEDPNTHYLIPTPSEEPAGSHIATPFVGPVGGKIHNMPMGPQPYQIPGNFGFGYPASFVPLPHSSMHQQQSQQQPYYPSSPTSQHPPHAPALPPGKNDLEILQNLKKLIKDGQHPFYRAVPSPAALASLYKGPIPTQVQPTIPATNAVTPSEVSRKQLSMQGKDSQPTSVKAARNQELNIASQSQLKNGSASSVANLKLGDLQIKDSSGPPSAGIQPAVRPPELKTVHPAVSPAGADVSNSHHPGKFGYHTRSWVERKGSDSMDVEPEPKKLPPGPVEAAPWGQADWHVPEAQPSRSATPQGVHAVHADDHDFDFERETTPNPHSDVGMGMRPPPGRARYYSPSGRPLTPNPYTTFEAEQRWFSQHPEPYYPHERAVYERPHDIPSEEEQRPSTETDSGHMPPALGAPSEPTVPLETHHPDVQPSAAADTSSHDQPPRVSDTTSAREADAVQSPAEVQQQDARPVSNVPPPPTEHLASDVDDIQSSRGSSVPPVDAGAAAAPVPPASPGSSIPSDVVLRPRPHPRLLRVPRPPPPPAPYGERITHPTPPQAKARNDIIPAGSEPRAPPHLERPNKKGKFQKGHHPGGPGRFNRQAASAEGAAPTGPGGGQRIFRPRSPSLDTRKPRDYRGPPRPVSRDRGSYRPEFHEARRAEGADADVPSPARYDGRPYSEFAPASASERRPSTYTGSPPPMSGGRGPPLEGPPGRPEYYSPYSPLASRGDWEIDDQYYKSRGWQRPSPGADREHFEREVYPPRPASWDVRAEREFIPRDEYSPLAGPAGDDRYIPGPPLAREADRAGRPPPGGYNPPYGRVRGRSPSPLGRAGAPPIDDARPPMKRAREDYLPPEYYPGPGGRAPPRRAATDYPPPRSGSASDWPPPSSASSAGQGGGPPAPPGSRDFRMREPPLEYAPAVYERPRSPPSRPSYPRGGYARGNDRGGYGMRPPQ